TSGILVNNGIINAPYYVGNGSLLTNVLGVDSTKLLKAGDTMTGTLALVTDSAETYSLTLATAASGSDYSMVVTTYGNVGIQIENPSVPLEVFEQIKVSRVDASDFGSAGIHLYPNLGDGYVRWSDKVLAGSGGENIGVLGSISVDGGPTWDLAYRSGASNMSTGFEVFRIKSNLTGSGWKFGIGTNNPVEKFHINANTLFGPNLGVPVVYISTTDAGVGVATTAITHKLTVDGGIIASSSITATGGLYGEIMASSITLNGNLGLGVNEDLAKLEVRENGSAQYTVIIGTNPDAGFEHKYDMVVTTQGRVGIGHDNPEETLHIAGAMRLGHEQETANTYIHFRPQGGDSYIRWEEAALLDKAVLGFKAAETDLLLCLNASGLCAENTEFFRIKNTNKMIVGGVADAYVPTYICEVFGDIWTDGAVYGDGSNLTGIVTEASNHTISGKLNLTESLTLSGSTLTVTGNAFSVGTSTFVVNSGKVGISTGSPAGNLDVNGTALFGAGINKSTFTVEGYWQPRWMTTAEIGALQPTALGQVIGNSDITDLCISTDTAAIGQWAIVGSKGIGDCK
ncbi:MAG: hypothetical protein KKD35_06265, partial [Elusimicrobia bacterium]|nr:hypothetical protein [Elusimicrobiota bacterium]